jgi:Uma2 family endonuclease
VLPRRDEYYLSAAPTAKDAILVVEIADSSVAYDRNVKSHLYARHQIREYWLLDLSGKVLKVYRRPGQDGYYEVRRLLHGDSVAPAAVKMFRFRVLPG